MYVYTVTCTLVQRTHSLSIPQPTETVDEGPFHNPDKCVSVTHCSDAKHMFTQCVACKIRVCMYVRMCNSVLNHAVLISPSLGVHYITPFHTQ